MIKFTLINIKPNKEIKEVIPDGTPEDIFLNNLKELFKKELYNNKRSIRKKKSIKASLSLLDKAYRECIDGIKLKSKTVQPNVENN